MHNLAIDWLDENYIASCYTSNEPTICVWDRRSGSRFVSVPSAPGATEPSQLGPALEFKNVLDRDGTIWSMRFSRTRRGCLGVLSNKGHFKAYDIVKEYMSEGQSANLDQTLGQGSSRDYLEPIYTKYVRDIRAPYNHPTRGCSESDRVVSFDFLNISASNQPSAITLAGNGKVEIATLQPPCPPVRLSSQGVLVRGGSSGNADFETVYPYSGTNKKISDVVKGIRHRALPGSAEQPASNGLDGSSQKDGVEPLSSRESREHSLSLGTLGTPLEVRDALTLMTVRRFRCKEGYLFDGTKNKEILADDSDLQDFWDWIERRSS